MELQRQKLVVKIGDREVTIYELTIDEYNELEEKLNKYLFDFGGDAREIGLEILHELTKLDKDYLKKNLTPRQVDDILTEVFAMSLPKGTVRAIERLREDFFNMAMKLLLERFPEVK